MEEREGIKPCFIIRFEVTLGNPDSQVGLYAEQLTHIIMGLFAMIGIPPIGCSFEIQKVEDKDEQGLDDDVKGMIVH